jgi:hypothetical protein
MKQIFCVVIISLNISACQLESKNQNPQNKLNYESKEIQDKKRQFCCVDWQKFKINDIEILGSDYNLFLKQFNHYNDEQNEFIQECGFLSKQEQGLNFYSHQFGFVEVVTYVEHGISNYVTNNVNVNLLLSNNYTIQFGELTFDKNFKPTISILYKHWNVDSTKFDTRCLMLSNGSSDDGLIMYFDENEMLTEIRYWSPC